MYVYVEKRQVGTGSFCGSAISFAEAGDVDKLCESA